MRSQELEVSSPSFTLFLPSIPQHTLTEYFLHAGYGVPEANRQPLPALRPDSLSEKQTRHVLTDLHSSQRRRVCTKLGANTEQWPASCSGSESGDQEVFTKEIPSA